MITSTSSSTEVETKPLGVKEAEKAWMDLTAEVANELTTFYRSVTHVLASEDRGELDIQAIDTLLRRRAAAQEAFLTAIFRETNPPASHPDPPPSAAPPIETF